MKIAFLGVRVPGHLNPMTTLARQLKARGHDVVFLSMPDAERCARAAGLPFIPFCENDFPVGSLAKSMAAVSKLQGQAALELVIKTVASTMESAFRNLPRTLRDTNVDALVLDEVQRGLGVVPLHLGMPYVHVSNALPFDFSGNAPVCTFDWQHETTPDALARNQAGVRSLLQAYEPITSVAHAYAKKVGLDVDWTDPFATISKSAWLTQMPKEFDFKISHWPAPFRYTGPFHDGLGRIESDFPWDRLTGEPLVYASMGTLQNGLESVFTSIAEAVGTRPGMQLVLSIGPSLDSEKIRSLPANSIVVKNAPQMELLKRSALCITHAGLNTALESLTQGVPMVAIPISIDQPGVAARIAYTKTGAYVPLRELSTSRLSTLIDDVLGNPEYRQHANKMREAILRTNGLEKATDLLEQAFNLSPKPLASSISWQQRDMADQAKKRNGDLSDRAIGAPSLQNIATNPSLEPRLPRIAIVGAGFVGSTTAYALMMSGMAAEIVLIDRDSRRAEGHVSDLRDAEAFSHTSHIFAGDFSDCCSADVTIITAGVSQSGQKSRMEGLRDTGAIVHGLVNDVCLQNPRGILLIASNPVDVLTYAAWRWSELPAGRVIGSGTSLDTSRFRRRLAEHYGIASANVHAYIIGEHGDSQIPVLSSARVAGFPLAEFSKELRLAHEESSLTRIAGETRTAGGAIIEAKGATYYGIGAALVRITRAILRDERSILTVSSRVPESMKLGEVSLSLPSIVDRRGITRVLPVALDRSERRALEASAEVVRKQIASLSETIPISYKTAKQP